MTIAALLVVLGGLLAAAAADKVRLPDGGIDFGGCVQEPDGKCCVVKEESVESVQRQPILECRHKNVEKCHYTYVTAFKPSQEEVCDENFEKKCSITFQKRAVQETVRKCYTPIRKVCGEPPPPRRRRRRRRSDATTCQTVHETSCTTRYIGKGEGKLVGDTQCQKLPVRLCGAGCRLVEEPQECHEKVVESLVEVPEEACDLNPIRTCRLVTKLVPRLNPSQQCTTVPQEICTVRFSSPRPVQKPLLTKWCLEAGGPRPEGQQSAPAATVPKETAGSTQPAVADRPNTLYSAPRQPAAAAAAASQPARKQSSRRPAAQRTPLSPPSSTYSAPTGTQAPTRPPPSTYSAPPAEKSSVRKASPARGLSPPRGRGNSAPKGGYSGGGGGRRQSSSQATTKAPAPRPTRVTTTARPAGRKSGQRKRPRPSYLPTPSSRRKSGGGEAGKASSAAGRHSYLPNKSDNRPKVKSEAAANSYLSPPPPGGDSGRAPQDNYLAPLADFSPPPRGENVVPPLSLYSVEPGQAGGRRPGKTSKSLGRGGQQKNGDSGSQGLNTGYKAPPRQESRQQGRTGSQKSSGSQGREAGGSQSGHRNGGRQRGNSVKYGQRIPDTSGAKGAGSNRQGRPKSRPNSVAGGRVTQQDKRRPLAGQSGLSAKSGKKSKAGRKPERKKEPEEQSNDVIPQDDSEEEEEPPFYKIPDHFSDELPEYIRPVPQALAALTAFIDTKYESYKEVKVVAPTNNPYAAPYPSTAYSKL